MKSLVIVLLICKLTSAKIGCIFNEYSDDLASEPVFIQKIGRESLLLPVKTFGILVPDSSFVEIYCPHGFRRELLTGDAQDHISTETKSVQITCRNGKVQRRHSDSDDDDDDVKFYELSSEDKYACKKPAISIYETHHSMCTGTSYIIGMEYGSEPAILGEICYDLKTMKPIYQNYKATKRSPVISHQNQYSPIHFFPFGQGPIDMPSEAFTLPIDIIQDRIEKEVGVVYGSVEYIYDQLIPADAFGPYFAHPLFAASFLGKNLWWKGLRMGNWRLFEEVLKIRSQVESYDVVLGTSGTVVIPSSNPDCDLMKQFSFEINSIRQSAPKFIWAYLKADNHSLQEEFVVIGVNTPYFEFFPQYDNIICRDICHSISWLAPLNKFRSISAFGYMYCCRVEDVRNKLNGLPDMHLKWHEYNTRQTDAPDYRDIQDVESPEDEREEERENNAEIRRSPFSIFRK